MKATTVLAAMASCLVVACSDSDTPSSPDNSNNATIANNQTNNATNNMSVAPTNNATNSTNGPTNNATNNPTNGSSNNTTNNPTNNATNNTNNVTNPTNNMTTPTPECDFEAVNGIVVIEAESLPLNEDWRTGTDGAITYIEWNGPSHNNDPTHGVMAVDVRISEPGRYQLQWYTQIGMGTNATEHNDSWVKFPDADDYYGLKGDAGAEVRRYWKPACEDQTFVSSILALPQVSEVTCAQGSTRDGWMKVYSSGAQDWRWSARTSDNDASNVMAEFATAGVYTFTMAARADFSRYDRIVLHQEDLSNAAVQDLSLAETACD